VLRSVAKRGQSHPEKGAPTIFRRGAIQSYLTGRERSRRVTVIRFNEHGLIKSYPGGGYNGWLVRLDRHESGGAYIYIIKDPNDPHSEGYDQFVSREADLTNQLKDWVIEWPSSQGS
jgi:hypothetical protein